VAYRVGPQLVEMWRYDQRHAGSLHVGDAAPGVLLTSLEGSTEVPLRSYVGGRPLILIFGSYT
jgi:hypothetical protein